MKDSIVRGFVAFLLLALAGANPARAEFAPVIEQSSLVSTTYDGMFSFQASGAGTLSVRLADIAWPEQLAALESSVYSSDGTLLRSLSGAGEMLIDVAGAGGYFTRVYARAAGALDMGVFSLGVYFEPAMAAVPLPGAVWLLLSALGLFGFRGGVAQMRALFAERRFA